jgi:serine/threonine-protein kinase
VSKKINDTELGADGTLPGLGVRPAAAARQIEPFAIGEVLSNTFEIKGVLGTGGMGVVYEALDRALNRNVAIKISLIQGPEFSLRHEGQALAAIRHPSLVAVYGLFEHRGIEYLVMERVRGVTLEEVLRQKSAKKEILALNEALELLIAIADGLGAIHASGIAHRDVKPANLMVAPGNRIIFTDFGLFAPQFERVARVAGSPEYMAPEAIRSNVPAGRAHLVDLYAFGIVMFQVLVGWVPFAGNNAAEVLPQQLNNRPPDIDTLRSDVPKELVDLAGNLLAKDPDERPPEMEPVLWTLKAAREKLRQRESGRHRIMTPPRP